MNQQTSTAYTTINRLTALWALSESGLGGLMHAFKIPFTGFFLGGFAVVIVSLLAHFAEHRWQDITKATLLVILVKAAASPHSPPMAYIAVAFQGLAGAICYSLIPSFSLAAVLFGLLALMESAVQKFLVMTLIFGESLWEALDAFFHSIAKDLHLAADFSFSFWLITAYTGVYTLWGILLGWWCAGLPQKLELEHLNILQHYESLTLVDTTPSEKKKKSRKRKWLGFGFVLLFITSTFILQGSGHKALYALLRTLAALLLLFYIIYPLIKWALQRWAQKRNQHEVQLLIDTLPELRNLIAPALQMAKTNSKGLMVYRSFVVYLIVLTLYTHSDEHG
jgi:hypothetical protein